MGVAYEGLGEGLRRVQGRSREGFRGEAEEGSGD